MDADPDEDDYDEIPVDDLIVDLRFFEVRGPNGLSWSRNGDLDEGLIDELSVRERPIAQVAQALGLLSERAEDGAPDGWLLEIDPADRRYEIELHEGVALESYGEDQLYATVTIGLPVDVDDVFERRVDAIVEPMLGLAGARGRMSRVSQIFRDEVTVMIRFESMTDRDVGELIDLAEDVKALLNAVRSGQPQKDVALNLILAGHAASLVGQPESEWLDVKREPWNLATAIGKAEAAKDMSSMANASGGMIVMPARTTVISGREVVSEVRDMPLDLIDLTQIRDVLNQWVFPPLPDLVTETVPTGEGRGRLVIAVGCHRADNWPHIVVGNSEGPHQNQSVSVWVRDGDRNRALTAPEVHALMRGVHRHNPDDVALADPGQPG